MPPTTSVSSKPTTKGQRVWCQEHTKFILDRFAEHEQDTSTGFDPNASAPQIGKYHDAIYDDDEAPHGKDTAFHSKEVELKKFKEGFKRVKLQWNEGALKKTQRRVNNLHDANDDSDEAADDDVTGKASAEAIDEADPDKTIVLPNIAVQYNIKNKYRMHCTRVHVTIHMLSGWMPSCENGPFYELSDDGNFLLLNVRPSKVLMSARSLLLQHPALKKVYKTKRGVDHVAFTALEDALASFRKPDGTLPRLKCKVPLPITCAEIGKVEGACNEDDTEHGAPVHLLYGVHRGHEKNIGILHVEIDQEIGGGHNTNESTGATQPDFFEGNGGSGASASGSFFHSMQTYSDSGTMGSAAMGSAASSSQAGIGERGGLGSTRSAFAGMGDNDEDDIYEEEGASTYSAASSSQAGIGERGGLGSTRSAFAGMVDSDEDDSYDEEGASTYSAASSSQAGIGGRGGLGSTRSAFAGMVDSDEDDSYDEEGASTYSAASSSQAGIGERGGLGSTRSAFAGMVDSDEDDSYDEEEDSGEAKSSMIDFSGGRARFALNHRSLDDVDDLSKESSEDEFPQRLNYSYEDIDHPFQQLMAAGNNLVADMTAHADSLKNGSVEDVQSATAAGIGQIKTNAIEHFDGIVSDNSIEHFDGIVFESTKKVGDTTSITEFEKAATMYTENLKSECTQQVQCAKDYAIEDMRRKWDELRAGEHNATTQLLRDVTNLTEDFASMSTDVSDLKSDATDVKDTVEYILTQLAQAEGVKDATEDLGKQLSKQKKKLLQLIGSENEGTDWRKYFEDRAEIKEKVQDLENDMSKVLSKCQALEDHNENLEWDIFDLEVHSLLNQDSIAFLEDKFKNNGMSTLDEEIRSVKKIHESILPLLNDNSGYATRKRKCTRNNKRTIA